jgi:hypothetical protein
VTRTAGRALYGHDRRFLSPFGPGGTLPPGRDRPPAPWLDPERRRQAQYLRRLARIIAASAGTEVSCELLWQEQRPFLPYLLVRGVPVWVVATSTGRRFLWNRYRSHSVTDAAGAAEAVLADVQPGEGPAEPDGASGH